jgi:CRISPR-associated protein Cmr6
MRNDLATIKQPHASSNAGLWFDKYVGALSDYASVRSALVRQTAGLRLDVDAYGAFYKRWEEALERLKPAQLLETRKATVAGRMSIGLGGEGVIETAITLHRTYGVPYIPGSALKGLAASYARNCIGEAWEKDKQAYNIVFGKMEEAGYITFHDALYVPGSANGQPLRADVITVHHPGYYRNEMDAAPADWDDPNPVPFLSATGDYLIALSTIPECREWLELTWEILKRCLQEEGIGAKTSSGYGRMELHGA